MTMKELLAERVIPKYRQFRKKRAEELYEKHNGDISKVADAMGIKQSSIRRILDIAE